jgi:hypothetical protein
MALAGVDRLFVISAYTIERGLRVPGQMCLENRQSCR